MTDNTSLSNQVDWRYLVPTVCTIAPQSALATLVSNAATVTKCAVQVTSESLTTASAASQALTLTLAGVTTTDLVFVQAVGGTNTRKTYLYEAACTANTVTITVYNSHASALNGTLIFNVWVLKA